MNVQPNHLDPDTPNEAPVLPPTPIVYESEKYHWQYKHIKLDMDEQEILDEARLNELGNDGWELTAVLTHNKTAYYYFKQPTVET